VRSGTRRDALVGTPRAQLNPPNCFTDSTREGAERVNFRNFHGLQIRKAARYAMLRHHRRDSQAWQTKGGWATKKSELILRY
jgi:hypothetical protein